MAKVVGTTKITYCHPQMKRGPMKNALYAGETTFIGKDICSALELAGYEVSFSAKPDINYDLVVDAASSSALELQTLLAGIGRQCGHYILLSSCDVYPPTLRLRPWCEEDADVCEDISESLPVVVKMARSLERELRLAAAGRFPFTVLRPALVEGENDPAQRTLWFASRILDGGLLVLPDGDLPVYRHVFSADLAQAIATVACRKEAFAQTMNVVGQGVLNYWGHAAMIRDGLRCNLQFAYVPAWRWRAAGLRLPMGESASSSFIEPSPLLRELGWHPSDELQLVTGLAAKCRDRALGGDASVYTRERRVLAEFEASDEYMPGVPTRPLARHDEPQSVLRGWSGKPASLALERLSRLQKFPTPVVKVRALALGPTEERLLKGEYSQQGSRAIGHNALLNLVDPGSSAPDSTSTKLAFGVMPCDDPDCLFCKGGSHGVLGIGCDGYGWNVCTTPASHMLSVPPELGMAALLADPLAALLSALEVPLREGDGPVWVAGRTVEAALTAWLVQDSGRPLHLVDRRVWDHDEFPVSAVETLEQKVRSNELAAPELAIDFTSAVEVTWPMAVSLAAGGHLYGRSRPLGITHGRQWHVLPAAAPSSNWLKTALDRLQSWQERRDLTRRVGPSIPRQLYWDALLPAPFSLPYLEDRI
jgi:hypothetical protein